MRSGSFVAALAHRSREELLHLVEKARALRRMLRAAFLDRLVEFLEHLLLLARQIDGSLHEGVYVQIAAAAAVQMRHTLAAQAEDLARLRAFRDRDACFGTHRRHAHFAAQGRGCVAQRQIGMQIVAVALENFMLLDEHLNEQIAAGAAVGAGFALALNADALTVVDARRNVDLQRLGLAVAAATLAVRTRIGNDLARTVAVRTGLLHLQKAAVDVDRTAAAAVRAGLLARALLAARTVTGFALFPNRHANVGLGAGNCLLECDFKRITHVGAAEHLGTASASAAGTAAENFGEDVAEVAESALSLTESAESAEAARCVRIHAGLAVAVVGGALLRIAQNRISLTDLFKLFFGLLVAVVAVGMVLHRQTSIRLFDFIVARITRNAKYLVIILISHSLSIVTKKHAKGRIAFDGGPAPWIAVGTAPLPATAPIFGFCALSQISA